MCDHQRGQIIAVDDHIGRLQHLRRSLWIKSGCVLIEEQELRLLQGCHEQCECLSLTTGQKSYLRCHTVFQTKSQCSQHLTILCMLLLRDSGFQSTAVSPAECQCQILLNLHCRCGSGHWILEHTAEIFGTLIFRKLCYIGIPNQDLSLIDRPYTGDCI